MRDFKGMKRQRGRNRGGGGGKPQHNANRAFDSNGPEGIKVRGAAQGVFEKYQQLARDAASAGDRVLAENYLQHAEHYFRVLRAMQPQRPVAEIIGRETFSSGYDIDFEAEPEEAVASEASEGGEPQAEGEGGDAQSREARGFDNNNGRREDRFQDRPRFENREGREGGRRDRWRDRDDRPRDRDDRPRDDRPRDDRPRDDRPRDDRPRDDRNRDDRPREDRQRDDRPREERGERSFERDREGRRDRFERGEREPREQREPQATVEPQAASFAASRDDEAASPRLRGQDGAVSEAPAFLSRGASAPAAAPEEGEAPKPRRGRPRKAPVSEAGEG